MQITATFDSIEEMQTFVNQMAGSGDLTTKTEVKAPRKKAASSTKAEPAAEQTDPEPETVKEPEEPEAEPEVTEAGNTDESPCTLEDVRARLTELNKSGKRAEVKELLASFGGVKLSDINPDDYSSLMKAAEEI